MRAIAFLILLAAPATARAQTAPSEPAVELQFVGLRPLADARFGWALSAQVAGDARGDVGAGIGAELALNGPPGCRYVVAGGALHQWRGHGLSAEQWVTLCLAHAGAPDVVGVDLDVAHRLQWEVRPALSAPPATWRRPLTRETVTVDLGLAGTDGETGSHGEVLPMSVVVDWMRQEGRDAMTVGFSFVTARCGPLGKKCISAKIPADEFELLGLYVYYTPGETDALVAGHSLGRLTGLRIGHGLKLDVDLRYGVGTISRAPADPGPPEMPNPSTTLAEAWAPVGSVALRGARWSVKLEQVLYPTFDVELALDDRLTAEAKLLTIDFSAFAARTAIYGEGREVSDWTAGAAARRDFTLVDGVTLSLVAEAGRSFYARLDGDTRPTPEAAVRGLAVLRAELGSSR